jgi:hypothetical protein
MHEQVYYILFRLFCLAALPTFQQITHRLKNRRNSPQQKEFFGLFFANSSVATHDTPDAP